MMRISKLTKGNEEENMNYGTYKEAYDKWKCVEILFARNMCPCKTKETNAWSFHIRKRRY